MSAVLQPRLPVSYTQVQAESCRRELARFWKDGWSQIESEPLEWSWYLDALCEHLTFCYLGDIKLLLVSVPPRTLKSTGVSVIWPAWIWTQEPTLNFLTTSYAQELSTRDALRMRDLIESPWYRERFGKAFSLKEDQNEKHLFKNDKGGGRMAASVGGKMTGFGGDIRIVDDPHNLQDVGSDVKRKSAVNWYFGPFRTRVNNATTARTVLIAQRSHGSDLTANILARDKKNRAVHLCLPNEYRRAKRCITVNPRTKKQIFADPRKEEGELLSPKRLGAEEVESLKADMTKADYDAQFQQDPTTEDGLILKRKWWQPWEYPAWHPRAGEMRELPEIEELVQSYDGAFEEGEENDYSARTTWGIFTYTPEIYRDVRQHGGEIKKQLVKGNPRKCAILLGAWRGRVDFPTLRGEAKRSNDKAKPDYVLVENKASGLSLIQELKRAGCPVKKVKIDGAGDKVARANMTTLPFEKGCVWYIPDAVIGKDSTGAAIKSIDVIDECAAFPKGEFDDWVDTVVMAVMWLRKRQGVEFEEEVDSIKLFKPQRRTGIGTS